MSIVESNQIRLTVNDNDIRELTSCRFSEKECFITTLWDYGYEQLENDNIVKLEFYPTGYVKGAKFATVSAFVVSRAFLASVNKNLEKSFVLEMTDSVVWQVLK